MAAYMPPQSDDASSIMFSNDDIFAFYSCQETQPNAFMEYDPLIIEPEPMALAVPVPHHNHQEVDAAAVHNMPATCAVCGWTGLTAAALEQHARIKKHLSFACNEAGCDKAYSRRDTYGRHRREHRPAVLACPHCPGEKRYSRKDHLLAHVKRKHISQASAWSTDSASDYRMSGSTMASHAFTDLSSNTPDSRPASSLNEQLQQPQDAPLSAVAAFRSICTAGLDLVGNSTVSVDQDTLRDRCQVLMLALKSLQNGS